MYLDTRNKPFSKYKPPQEKYGTPYYLTIDERNELYNFDLSDCPALERQRDIFVFQCLIGCRVGDLYKFTKSSVIDGAIQYIAEKTKGKEPKTVRVPLNSIATKILAKYADLEGEQLLPLIAEQKYNEAIKEAFTVAGINRKVTVLNKLTGEVQQQPLNEIASSHLARRTFCGNL
jgi:integrase